MQIAYLVPEFPGQTHIFFWRERAALRQMGVATHLVSTRRPPRASMSHNWSDQAERETFYLTDLSLGDILQVPIQFMRFGPTAWVRAVMAAIEDCSPRDWLLNFGLLLLAVRLATFMRARKLTHIHSHSCSDSALVAMFANRLANISYSLTLHSDLHDYGRQQNIKWRHAAFAITITRRLYEQVHQELHQNLPPRVGLAPMGVDPAVFKRTKDYKPWNGQGPLRLFSCGRLNRVKGHQDLIKAVSILTRSGMGVYLEIAGEDENGGNGFHRELDALIVTLELTNTVVLLGAVAEQRIFEGLEAAHLFVLASHHEPLGVAIMEALSCETPVIATNRGGVPELIDHGLNGYLVSAQDPKVIAEAIEHLANNPSLAMKFSASGRSRIERYFSANVSANELKRLLEQMKGTN